MNTKQILIKNIKRIIKIFQDYYFNLILIWLAIFVYRTTGYYINFLRPETQSILLYLAITYTILGFFYHLKTPPEKRQNTKGRLVFKLVKKSISKYIFRNRKIIKSKEKIALLFVLVKFFYLPIMLNFVIANYYFVSKGLKRFSLDKLFTLTGFNNWTFSTALGIIFLIDTFIFAIGYASESKLLKNRIKSVEPTLLGWIAALACYPPFNSYVTKHINWYANDHIFFFNDIITFIFRMIIIILLLIYLSATFALGTKASNLTNRGIITKGPYAIVRHPAYIAKNTVWWLTIIPIISIPAFLSVLSWSLIYHLRTLTEERHLSKDPEYIEYCKKVKYRYIPRIY